MKKIAIFLIILGLLLFGCATETSGQCSSEKAEVCGSDGVTYTNECYAKEAGAVISHTGACGTGQNGSVVSPNCVDSDNGKNALEYGTTTKGGESFNDTCSPTTNAVFEYYCLNNAITSETVPCPAGTECSGGKCGEVLCSDTDGGQNTEVKGTAKKGSDSFTDNCSSYSNVLEYYCSNNQILSKVIACASGKACEDGACVVSACTDNDGGFNIYEKGATRGSSGITYVDVCSGVNSVTEYYCSEGNVFHTTVDCGGTYSCGDGSCIPTACRDTDLGQDEEQYGSVYAGGQQYDDYCYDGDTVNEYYCDGASAASKRIDCASDEMCVNGECTSNYCTDSDGGKDKNEYGTVEKDGDSWNDNCYDSDTVTEYYCSDGNVESTRLNCDSGDVCVSGECRPASSTCSDTDGGNNRHEEGTVTVGSHGYDDLCTDFAHLTEYYCNGGSADSTSISCMSYNELCYKNVCSPAECVDSDGGKDAYAKGTATESTDNGYVVAVTDSCKDSYTVAEGYCSGLLAKETDIGCAQDEICSSGKCIEAKCADSDGGIDYYTKGTATKGQLSNTDTCNSKTQVREYYCSEGNIVSTTYNCGINGCNNGACVKLVIV